MHLQYLKRFYPDFKGKKVLELGCGRGDFLLECHKEGLDIIGVDINSEYIKISEEKIKKSGFEPHIILAKGEELPFKDDYFDFINCAQVLEHTNNPEGVLKECYRILKKDGCLFVTIPNKFSMRDPHYKILFLNWLPKTLKEKYIKIRKVKRNPYRCPDNQNINDMHYYTYFQFKHMVKQNEFFYLDTKKEQLNNPELILNCRFKKIIHFLNRMGLNFIINFAYFFSTIFYLDSFHFLLKKK